MDHEKGGATGDAELVAEFCALLVFAKDLKSQGTKEEEWAPCCKMLVAGAARVPKISQRVSR